MVEEFPLKGEGESISKNISILFLAPYALKD